MGPPCSFKCRLVCANKFSEEERQAIFNSYWELGNLQRQRAYLSSCIKPLKVAYRRIKVDVQNNQPAKPRNPNTAYYLLINGIEKRVCKKFLLNTLGIAERTLRTVIHAKNEDLGAAPQDKRGHHKNHSNLPEEVRQSIIDHIQSIPKIESHYLRANTSREYVDGGLSVSEMDRNYEVLRRENNLPTAPYAAYLYIFNTQFNIGFFIPKKDQCDVCVGYKNAPTEVKPQLEVEYKSHLEEKSLSRLEKQRDMNNGNLFVATYDLQAVLPCPVGDSSAFFYKTRLNCYNFTVTDGKNGHTTCYFWHEGMGHRGAIEIGSCVYKYLEELATKHPNCDVIFYSDNCCGQQKNKYILTMYFFAVSKLNIKSITHKFLIRGHTQNEGDTAHSLIEKCIKKERKSSPIYVPDQYVNVIRKAKKSGNPFKVFELNYDSFFDLKVLAEELNINLSKNVHGDQIKLSELKVVQFTKNKNTFEYKLSYKTENMLQANITVQRNLRTSRPTRSIDEIYLKPAYNSKIPISERKKQDILQLIEKNIVPHYYAEYYRNL
ncbi:unnamed protein product [Colias eurytheme]|nr:unnamed protein product [Colias eurytheme]